MTSAAQPDSRPPRRPAVSRRMVAVGVGVVLLVAGVAGATHWRPGQDGQDGARPSQGVPLRSPSGLRLLVAGDPTVFVLDVDTGAIQPVTGVPTDEDRSTHVESVGKDAVVVSRRDCRGSDCDADSVVYLVRHGGTVRRLPEVVDGVAGGDLVLSTVEPGRLIALTDVGSGVSHRLPWPSKLDAHVMGLVGGHPNGRLAHVAFYPALDGAEQTLDVWLLDITTRRWRQLPDMPLRLAPSKPQLRWTADGRLLLLAGLADDPAGLVAVWRPGEPRIAVRRVRLPEPERRTGFRFAIW